MHYKEIKVFKTTKYKHYKNPANIYSRQNANGKHKKITCITNKMVLQNVEKRKKRTENVCKIKKEKKKKDVA